jgi:hypothetical protein
MHTPSTHTLTLAFSSLHSTDDLLELLASDPPRVDIQLHPNSTRTRNTHDSEKRGDAPISAQLVDMPFSLFPPSSFQIPSDKTDISNATADETPKIHHSFLRPLETVGTDALISLLGLIRDPPVLLPARSHYDILRQFVSSLVGVSTTEPCHLGSRSHDRDASFDTSIRHVEIVGHGLGSAIGMLTALALNLDLNQISTKSDLKGRPTNGRRPVMPSIRATLFGSPRVGNQAFASWVDSMLSSLPSSPPPILVINRITSFADTIPHLPARHLSLAHPSIGEIWLAANPNVGYACRADTSHDESGESSECGGAFKLQQTRLMDHMGSYAGVWLGAGQCGNRTMVEM